MLNWPPKKNPQNPKHFHKTKIYKGTQFKKNKIKTII